jgi:DNA polymerase III epsilon subunit family exonuclease
MTLTDQKSLKDAANSASSTPDSSQGRDARDRPEREGFNQHSSQGQGQGQVQAFDRRRKSANAPAKGRTKHLAAALENGSYIAFDIETTGGNPEKNGITEIFALRYRDGQIHDTFYSMVNPGVSIPPIVRRMTGITDKMVRDAPPIRAIMPDFIKFIADDVLVSHNTIGDMKFLRYFADVECSHEIGNYYLCTHLLVEKLAPNAPDKSLKGLAGFFSLPGDAKLHRAEADAYLTLELFKILLEKMRTKGIPSIADAIRFQGDFESGTRLGWGVKSEALKVLPEKTGVFYLYDYSGQVTFLSSAHNLQREVRRLQKLNALPKQLLRSVLSSCDLKFEETPTAFAASLLEAKMLTRHKIRFDPSSWHQRTANFIYLCKDADEYRLTTGPLVEGVTALLGPIRGGKEVTLLLEHISNAVGRKATKKGLKLTPEEASVIGDFLSRRPLKSGLKEKVLKLLPKHAERINFVQNLRDYLKKVSIPEDLFSAKICSGVLALGMGERWHLYAVADGRLLSEFNVDGDLREGLLKNGLNERLYRQIKAESKKFEAESSLSLGDAILLNRMFWWAFFGSRHENVKIIHVEELPRF